MKRPIPLLSDAQKPVQAAAPVRPPATLGIDLMYAYFFPDEDREAV